MIGGVTEAGSRLFCFGVAMCVPMCICMYFQEMFQHILFICRPGPMDPLDQPACFRGGPPAKGYLERYLESYVESYANRCVPLAFSRAAFYDHWCLFWRFFFFLCLFVRSSESKVDGTGGSNGSCMRMSPEKDWGANAGLGVARDFVGGERGARGRGEAGRGVCLLYCCAVAVLCGG